MRKVCGILFIFFDLILLSCNGKEVRDIQSAQTNLEPVLSNTHIIEEPVTILQENATVQTETEAQAAIPPPVYSDTELRDPFLLHQVRGLPTIRIDVSDDCIYQRIRYKDFDNKVINYGDYDDGVTPLSIYLFQEGLFLGIDYAETENNNLVRRVRNIALNRNSDGTVVSTERYGGPTARMVRQDVYNKTNNILVANEGLERGLLSSAIVEEDSKFLYYDTHENYKTTPVMPSATIEFLGDEVEVCNFSSSSQEIFSKYHFINGILMKTEFPVWGYTETYTVREGKGEIIVTNSDGTEREQRMLERRINDKGYLEYEAVRFPDGTGYEQYFRKGLFR